MIGRLFDAISRWWRWRNDPVRWVVLRYTDGTGYELAAHFTLRIEDARGRRDRWHCPIELLEDLRPGTIRAARRRLRDRIDEVRRSFDVQSGVSGTILPVSEVLPRLDPERSAMYWRMWDREVFAP